MRPLWKISNYNIMVKNTSSELQPLPLCRRTGGKLSISRCRTWQSIQSMRVHIDGRTDTWRLPWFLHFWCSLPPAGSFSNVGDIVTKEEKRRALIARRFHNRSFPSPWLCGHRGSWTHCCPRVGIQTLACCVCVEGKRGVSLRIY